MVHAYAGSRAGLKSVIAICELNAEATGKNNGCISSDGD